VGGGETGDLAAGGGGGGVRVTTSSLKWTRGEQWCSFPQVAPRPSPPSLFHL